MSEDTTLSRAPVGFWRWVWRLSAGLFATVVVALALGVGLFRVLVPMFPDYQQRIETAATNALGYPLEFSDVDARWRRRGPELLFSNVRLRTADGERVLLEARRCRVVFDVWSLLKGGAVRPIAVALNDTSIQLSRDADGEWFVQGQSLSELRGKSSDSSDPWGLTDGALELRNINLIVNDQLLQRQVDIADLDLDIEVNAELLRLEGGLQLGVETDGRVEFSIDATGRSDALEKVDWQGFARGSGLNVSAWRTLVPAAWKIESSQPAKFSLWFEAVGESVEQATADFDMREFSLGDDATQLAKLAGRFAWEKTSSGWRLQGDEMAVHSGVDSGPEFQGELIFSHIAQNDQWTLSADYLPMGEIAAIAATLPVASLSSTLQSYAPRGVLRDVEGFVATNNAQLVDFGLVAQAEELAVSSVDGSPAFSGLNARIFGGYAQGGAQLSSDTAVIELPGVLREAIQLDTLAGELRWTHTDANRNITLSDVLLANADLRVGGRIDLQKALAAANVATATAEPTVAEPATEAAADVAEPERQSEPWHADMSLTVDNVVLLNAPRYFPVNKFKPKMLAWLDQALAAGSGSQGVFTLRGPLNKFPFVDPADGDFNASIQLNDATLSYHAEWPVAEALDARLEFKRDSLSATVTAARLRTMSVANAQVLMPSLKQPQLLLEGDVIAALEDIRAYVDATPLVEKLGETWGHTQFFGQGTAQLALDLNLKEPEATVYSMALQVTDTEVIYKDWSQRISGLQGAIRLTEKSLVSDYADGQLLGAPVQISLQASEDPDVLSDVSLQGITNHALLASHLSPELDDFLEGSAAWTAQTVLRKTGRAEQPFVVRLQSPLDGMRVLLPRPLAKNDALESRFLDAQLTVISPEQLQSTLDYGDTTSATTAWRLQDRRWRAHAGELRFGGGAATLPETPLVRVVGSVGELDMTEVLDFIEEHPSDDPWITLDQAELSVTELSGLEQSFGATNLNLQRSPTEYQIRFTGDRLDGSLTVPQQQSPTSPVLAELSNLMWQSQPESESEIDPRRIPSLKLNAENFQFNDYALGALSMHLEARENLVAVREFATNTKDLTTRTTGSWVFSPTESTTYLVTEVSSSNVRGALKAMNQADFIEANEARARLELSWPQGWTSDYLNTVEGEISMSVGPGKISSVDPGAGRVFGLLSVGALPRRLSLDFRDVFDSGFGFDGISGDFVLSGGNAVTENLALRGPAANVVVTGRAGLVARDYDQRAYVYANFGSTLPIAGALAGGPAVGAALLLFSEIFKRPLQQMGQVTYTIDGSWDDPKIERLSASRPEPQATPEAPAEGGEGEADAADLPQVQEPGVDEATEDPGGDSSADVTGGYSPDDEHSIDRLSPRDTRTVGAPAG